MTAAGPRHAGLMGAGCRHGPRPGMVHMTMAMMPPVMSTTMAAMVVLMVPAPAVVMVLWGRR